MSVRSRGYDLDCTVGGRPVPGRDRFAVSYPYTGEVIGTAPDLDPETVRLALDRAASAGPPPARHERARVLEAVAARLADQRPAVARLITLESGLCLKDTLHEVERAIDVFRLSAAEARRDDGRAYACDATPNGGDRRAYTLSEPVRLVAAITPFNHPLNQVAHKVAPAIAAGAPLVLKPSEKTPLAALALVRILHEEGLPPDRVNVVTGAAEPIVSEMLAHPDVELVSFTGSAAVGRALAERLGYRRALLELGGNDPLIVLPDADLGEAVRLALAGAFRNSGQRCTAVKRLLVHERVADEFAARLAEAARALLAGDPLDPDTDVGTVIDADAAAELERRIHGALEDGAVLLAGGERDGALLAPTVLDRVSPRSQLVAEESFGPIAPILRVRSLDEAIELANATRYGLAAGVVTNDLRAINRCIRELRCGTVNVREAPGFRSELAPFGGIKDSGLGVKEGIAEAIRAMTFTKLYTLPWDG